MAGTPSPSTSKGCSRCSSGSTAPRRRRSCASALEYGVPRDRVMDELEREVERRLARLEER